MFLATKQAINIQLATTVGRPFVRELDLDFAGVYIWLVHVVVVLAVRILRSSQQLRKPLARVGSDVSAH